MGIGSTGIRTGSPQAAERSAGIATSTAARVTRLLALLAAFACSSAASAAGIDSRTYSCDALHALIAARGFVFISQATFGDFVVASQSYCPGDSHIQWRSVAAADNPECLINYCVPNASRD
jgi:hypothetical protein